MTKYKVYYIPFEKPMEQISMFEIEETIIDPYKHDEWEYIGDRLDTFLRNNFKKLIYEGLELVLVNSSTGNADFRFNYVTDWEDEKDERLYSYLDHLESDFLYEFVELYKETFGEMFKGNNDRINRV